MEWLTTMNGRGENSDSDVDTKGIQIAAEYSNLKNLHAVVRGTISLDWSFPPRGHAFL